jgi:hypothetical protein
VIRDLLLENFLDLEGLCKNKANIFPARDVLSTIFTRNQHLSRHSTRSSTRILSSILRVAPYQPISLENERKFFAQKIEPAILTVLTILRISSPHFRPFLSRWSLPHSHHTMPPNTSFTYNRGFIILRPRILFPCINLSQSRIILSSPTQSHVFAPNKRQHLHPT